MDTEKHKIKHSIEDLIEIRKKLNQPDYINDAIESLANEICLELIETERHNDVHIF